MVRYHIRVNTGDKDKTHMYYFVHESWQTVSEDYTDKAFDVAVSELNRIYKTYGRFATQTGVIRLFKSFGFMQTTKD